MDRYNDGGSIYDKEYFENGLASGKSLYNGYVWMPERSLVEATAIIDALKIPRGAKILDYGASKGFLVKALRMLGRDAYGLDISRYAICTADKDVRQYLRLSTKNFPYNEHFDFCVAKDVFEHLTEDVLEEALKEIYKWCKILFVVVPLGKETGKVNEFGIHEEDFVVPEYSYDATHVLAKNIQWWCNIFEKNRFKVTNALFRVDGLKDNWSHYPNGNGFLFLKKKGDK